MVDDILPTHFTLDDISSDYVNDVVANVKQLDEVVKFLLNHVLDILRQLLRNVLVEIQSNELTS